MHAKVWAAVASMLHRMEQASVVIIQFLCVLTMCVWSPRVGDKKPCIPGRYTCCIGSLGARTHYEPIAVIHASGTWPYWSRSMRGNGQANEHANGSHVHHASIDTILVVHLFVIHEIHAMHWAKWLTDEWDFKTLSWHSSIQDKGLKRTGFGDGFNWS